MILSPFGGDVPTAVEDNPFSLYISSGMGPVEDSVMVVSFVFEVFFESISSFSYMCGREETTCVVQRFN